MGFVGALKVRSAALDAKEYSLGREKVKDRWSKLQNFNIVIVYMRNKLMRPTLSCLPSWSIIIIQLSRKLELPPPET